MDKKKFLAVLPLIGGAAFALLGLSALWEALGVILYARGLMAVLRSLLLVAGRGLVSFCLLTKRRDLLPTVGFGLLALYGPLTAGGLTSLLALAGWALCALICFSVMTDKLPQFRETAAKLWFVPAILLGASVVVSLWGLVSVLGGFRLGVLKILLSTFLRLVLEVGGTLAAMLWAVGPDGLPRNQEQPLDR